MSAPRLRAGFEVELLAPPGASRRDLAEDLARRRGGSVRPFFHVDTEGSAVPGVDAFWHLTPGFRVLDAAGEPVCSLVDDTSVVADLDARARPRPGWYRVVSDDARLLRLVARHADPAAGIGSVLGPVAALFGTPVQQLGAVHRVDDAAGATIAMAAPLPGERERVCEVITPPVEAGHEEVLEALLAPARALGFSVPREAAVHVHLDAAPFRDPGRFAAVVRSFGGRRRELHERFGTNPHCRRLAPLPAELVELCARRWPDWESLRAAAARTPVTKFCDLNVTRVLGLRPGPDTLEVRILPGALDGASIAARLADLEDLLAAPGQPCAGVPGGPSGGVPGACGAGAGRSTR
ncbi:amidoligase family protein [Kineococcus sp. SYSU DK006]|uniref:amidoligase family protein n=1 Tax=Kineococcus sp. SYSU DK006 TaxID=3383127 RepID=UPI003D7F1131